MMPPFSLDETAAVLLAALQLQPVHVSQQSTVSRLAAAGFIADSTHDGNRIFSHLSARGMGAAVHVHRFVRWQTWMRIADGLQEESLRCDCEVEAGRLLDRARYASRRAEANRAAFLSEGCDA